MFRLRLKVTLGITLGVALAFSAACSSQQGDGGSGAASPAQPTANAGTDGGKTAPATERPAAQSTAAPQVIKISAQKFNFTPSEITVKKGVPVVLEITSVDRQHGFKLPDFNVRGTIEKGQVTRVQFTPDKVGRFVFACDVFCGSGHEDMNGLLIVTN